MIFFQEYTQIKQKIVLRLKTEYYLELLTPEIKKLLGSTKSNITKDKNGKDLPELEITELVFVYCNIVNYDYWQDLRVWDTLILTNRLVNC